MSTNLQKQISLRLGLDLFERIARHARETERSVTAVIRRACKQYLDRHAKK